MKKKNLHHPIFHNQPMKRRVAFHEAGHVIASLILGLPFEAVSLRKKQDQETMFENGREVFVDMIYTDGVIWSSQRTDSVNEELLAGKLDLREAISTMAGPQAEVMLIGEIDEEAQRGAGPDMNGIAACCRVAAAPGIPLGQLPCCVMEKYIFPGLAMQAEELLRKNWTAVEALANELLKKEYLSYSEVMMLVEGFLKRGKS